MKFKSPVYSSVSGSIAGITYGSNRGGLYARARAIPTDPSSTLQQDRRAAFGTVAQAWRDSSQESQDGWSLYGQNVPVVDTLGDSINLSGQQWFQAINTQRLLVSLAILTVAPAIFNRGVEADLELAIDSADAASPGTIDVSFGITQDWVSEDDAFLIIQIGVLVGAGINFFNGPWYVIPANGVTSGIVAGDAKIPPTSPASIDMRTTATAGQKIWVRARTLRADGRLSEPFILGPAVVA